MDIRDLTNKVANNGANVNGKLTAEEYNVLITQVKNMSNGAVYMGVATPTTTPQTFDGNVELVYLATTAGKYTAFGNIVVNNDEICALRWRYSVGWGKEVIATNDYTNEDKAEVAKIAGKQDTLTLTVKDNGNIVLGNIAGQTKEFMPATPSGDPMHYAYEAAGAIWNATEAAITRTAPWGGESVSHLSGCWYLNGLGDIDNKEMRRIYTLGACNFSSPVLAYGNIDGSYDASVIGSVKTNICRLSWYNGTVTTPGIAYYNQKIIVVNMCIYPSREEGSITMTGKDDFYNCQALRVINGKIRFTNLSKTNFHQCYSLQHLKIVGLANNLYLGDSKALSKASLLYMINQSAATSPIVITLHADVYAWASTDIDVQTALAAKSNVTIASV